MFAISDQHIEFILADLRKRGIEMESLQFDLLDHICCIVESEMSESDDFERFYHDSITRFYTNELQEIEVETKMLLTNKHFYNMKKAMISSGAVSTVALCAGVILKFMHLPGASILIVIGIFLMSFVFLPLMLALKIREDQGKTVRLVSTIGSFSAILLTLGVLFKIMHWPGATIMCILSLLIMLFVFIPIYFFTGIRNPQTKVNTIVSSIMMLTGCVLILVLIKTPRVSKQEFIDNTADFLQNEMIVRNEKMLMENSGMISKEVAIGTEIYTLCEELKIFLLTSETGQPALDRDFVAKNAILSDSWADVYFSDSPQDAQKLNRLNSLIGKYNKINADKESELPQLNSASRISPALNRLIQIQLLTLQDQRKMLAMN